MFRVENVMVDQDETVQLKLQDFKLEMKEVSPSIDSVPSKGMKNFMKQNEDISKNWSTKGRYRKESVF